MYSFSGMGRKITKFYIKLWQENLENFRSMSRDHAPLERSAIFSQGSYTSSTLYEGSPLAELNYLISAGQRL